MALVWFPEQVFRIKTQSSFSSIQLAFTVLVASSLKAAEVKEESSETPTVKDLWKDMLQLPRILLQEMLFLEQ